jgi:hypothetical protein
MASPTKVTKGPGVQPWLARLFLSQLGVGWLAGILTLARCWGGGGEGLEACSPGFCRHRRSPPPWPFGHLGLASSILVIWTGFLDSDEPHRSSPYLCMYIICTYMAHVEEQAVRRDWSSSLHLFLPPCHRASQAVGTSARSCLVSPTITVKPHPVAKVPSAWVQRTRRGFAAAVLHRCFAVGVSTKANGGETGGCGRWSMFPSDTPDKRQQICRNWGGTNKRQLAPSFELGPSV